MPIASDEALAEQDLWRGLADRWSQPAAPEVWKDRPATEKAVVVFTDPAPDLERRAAPWGRAHLGQGLGELALFAAGLCHVEANSWNDQIRDVAARAYEARRFLIGDRIIHWAVPWLDAVGRCYPDQRERAHLDRDALLTLGDQMRVAPRLPGREGLLLAGEDSYGPTAPRGGDEWLRSLWSGDLILEAIVAAKNKRTARDLAVEFSEAEVRWGDLADRHPGSAQLWSDLASRAHRTAASL